ncbi:MAG: tetratricopeptide repeat protein, partial [Prevotella sp.]
HRLLIDIFDAVVTSSQWGEASFETFKEILLSPTIDSNDQQVIVSALMLSTMNMFDECKFRLLVDTYRNSNDEKVRQRALVGWVFALHDCHPEIFPEVRQTVEEMLADEKICSELTELQIQMLYCMKADSDNRKIQTEIIPDILKHNNLNITPNGIEEKQEDVMQDILDPEASERNMEKLEESFRKMMDMQKAGSDIYFGGFSHMKGFPFFNTLCNWFVPFYPEHPDISPIYDEFGKAKMLDSILGKGPFCNSDKYSLLITFRKVYESMPQNMREMLGNDGAAGMMGLAMEESDSPAYIRRIYLYDIYRFFKLFHWNKFFYDPFNFRKPEESRSGFLFLADGIFKGTPIDKKYGEVGAFMVKNKMPSEVAELLDNYSEESKDYRFYMLAGHLLMRHKDVFAYSCLKGLTATECYRHALLLKPDDKRARHGYARASFYDGDYEEACAAYGILIDLEPDNKTYLLGYSICLTNGMRYEEALKVLYRLDYEYPEDVNVSRVLARALMGDGKYDNAERIYRKLRDNKDVTETDILNEGYCFWFSGKIHEAVASFVDFLHRKYPDIHLAQYREAAESDIIEIEKDSISAHGITDTEKQLMVDCILAHVIK